MEFNYNIDGHIDFRVEGGASGMISTEKDG